jgi:hypothetical protein
LIVLLALAKTLASIYFNAQLAREIHHWFRVNLVTVHATGLRTAVGDACCVNQQVIIDNQFVLVIPLAPVTSLLVVFGKSTKKPRSKVR